MNVMSSLSLSATLIAALATSAAGQDWLDDFEDGSVADGVPVPWEAVQPLPALMSVADGDLVLGVQVVSGFFLVGAAAVPIPFPAGVSIRARMQGTGEATGIGLSWQDPELASVGYIAELTAGAELFLLRTDDPATAVILDSTVVEVDPTDEVLIQLDAFEGLIEVTVWSPGAAKPSPQISAFDSNHGAGAAGVFVQDLGGNRPGDSTAVVRYAQAASAPLTHSDIGDLDASGVVDGADLGLLLANWSGVTGCPPVVGLPCVGDLNADNAVDGGDLGLLLANWG